jgi:hypothetical protein
MSDSKGNPGNIDNASKAQQSYYEFMALKERLGADHPVLKIRSEKDTIMVAILEKLGNIGESTAEWAQVVDLTKSEDRMEQAKVLADLAWNKKRAELVLAQYVPDDLNSVFSESKARLARVASINVGSAASRSPAAAAAAALTGGK